jgi:GntR family transcriptional regulator / MocR family aminotransferase
MSTSHTNLAWDTLLDVGRVPGGVLHERLARAIREAIRASNLPHGSALPASRKLAVDLGCSRWVVTQAYEQLIAEGYLEARVGSATRVRWPQNDRQLASTAIPRRGPVVQLDLGPGLPDLRAFPRNAWLRAVRAELASAPHAELAYAEPGGHPRLRQVVSEYLQRVRGALVQPEDVTITTGVTDGMTQVFGALVAAGGGAVAVEDPGWSRLHQAVSRAGLTAVGVPVDAQGMCVDALLDRSGPRVDAVIVTPAHQFPSGAVMHPARRRGLMEWARSANALILEDDYDAEFRYDRRPIGTVQGTDPSLVALFGSLSKTLAPALSLGWVVTPPPWTAALRAGETRMTGPPVIDQLALARFIQTGDYDRHLRTVRQRYRARRDSLLEALRDHLPECSVTGVAAGLHIVVFLPPGSDGARIVARAAERGVRVMDLASCCLAGDTDTWAGLVLGYGNLDDHAVEQAVLELARAIHE